MGGGREEVEKLCAYPHKVSDKSVTGKLGPVEGAGLLVGEVECPETIP